MKLECLFSYIYKIIREAYTLVSSNLFIEMEGCETKLGMYKLLVLTNPLPKNNELFQTTKPVTRNSIRIFLKILHNCSQP